MVQEVSVKKLKDAPYNPRVTLEPGMPDYDKLQRSMETFGNVLPIVWNKRTGHVVGGHQRLAVLRSMGAETALCSVVDLPLEDEKILNLALNKIKGKWDYDRLSEILEDFDREVATLTGFSEDEIAVICANDDDLFSGDGDYEDFYEPPEEQIIGGSYVVTLVFASQDLAKEWAEANGYKGQVREGSGSTVIRMEE